MENPPPNRLSCPKCEKIANRIFEKIFDEEILEKALAYIILGWIGCPDKKCHNYFKKKNSKSRCPVCRLWSVKLEFSGEFSNWQCHNKDCQWEITLPNLATPT